MPFRLPQNVDRFSNSALEFWKRISAEKRNSPLLGNGWYPFDSLSCLDTVRELIASDYGTFASDIGGYPVADLGCADGDFAMLFASWGADVDAIDYAPNNFNRMQGVARLNQLLGYSVGIHGLNLDGHFRLPRGVYGLTFFLGTLYHLKNPYAVLEQLAFQTRWCILSTRIAQVTPSGRACLENEPVAYLADRREIANDETNFWIFSATGLLRLLQRTRWAIVATKRIGCLVDSNPIDGNADERMFVLARSRVHFQGLEVRLKDGWHQPEGSYRWTARRFSLEIVLPLEKPFNGFVLPLFIPDALVASGHPVSVSCAIRGEVVGTSQCGASGAFEFRGELPPFALHEPILRLDFTVDTVFTGHMGDQRELGVCVPGDGRDGVKFQLLNSAAL